MQRSIGLPILRNLLLDPLLKELETGGNYELAFTDDLVLAFPGVGIMAERYSMGN